ncbi:hypothetical protein TBLA_0A03010 [Henningerozyma blattae CBS 6284]|uniref:Uncharacterized protein n=1 Tax=Henningerozyma blattae (strain ATCC 34711 / CBS 6284 / DSM 70876 / NBRC 10599 / NRRL Y-10934 / UCD 77-7) TaxID=1071380 RepID=I2GVE9_HENB6|nr:hypothetical protein TBLA_0A03010 [Tetrapisispora blattae CBS 6284]CCH58101.1 hypothetical protein TBLA_0A03010 [Tetrapisispora blattae CBS 6284]
MLVDLNVPWPQKDFQSEVTPKHVQEVEKILLTLHTLGYTHIAINFTVKQDGKFPTDPKKMNPINIEQRFGELMEKTGLKLYSRLTLIIDDPSRGQSLNKISQYYDILSAKPISEKGVLVATTHLDIDVLTFDYSNRLPVILKHKNICSCVKKGIKVEITYSDMLKDNNTRRQFVANVRNVVRSSRNRGLVVSSGATTPVQCRNVVSLDSVLKMLGIKGSCTTMMGDTAATVLLQGRLRRRSNKQTIAVGGDQDVVDDASNGYTKIIKRPLEIDADTEEGALKKTRL